MRTPRKLRTPGIVLVPLFGLAGCTAPADTGSAPDPTAPTEARVEGLALELHGELGTLVYASWEQQEPATAWVEYSFDEDTWLTSPSESEAEGPQEHLLLGIPYDEEVRVRVVNDFGDGPLPSEETTIHTDALPEGAPEVTVSVDESDLRDSSYDYLLTSMISWPASGWTDWAAWTVIVDRQGRLVWARKTPDPFTTLYAQTSLDGGDLLVDHNSFWGDAFDDGATSEVHRLDIDGSEVAVYDTPGLHHPFTEAGDGSVLWGAVANYHTEETLERIDPEGDRQTLWTCSDYLEDLGEEEHYCAANALHWDAEHESLIFSFYSFESVLEIDYATAEVLRLWGHLDGAWPFDPEDSAFWWQHGVHRTADGTLLVSTKPSDDRHSEGETAVREYEIDDEAQVLREVWCFGEEDGVGGDTMGEARRLSGGNTLHNYGDVARLREATPDGTVVWDLSWSNASDIGRMTPLTDLYALAP